MLITHRIPYIFRQDNFRHHWWNEAGLLVASIDNASCGYYGYDGNGNRAYKLTGQSVQDQYNAGEWQYYVNFNDAVLYVNPYFIVTPKGYTRHYYNGSQRIAAQIGRISDLPKSIIDTSAVARERIANAQAYMASILGATEKIDISTGDIADIDGDELEELQWQCLDTNTIVFHITLQSDTNMLLPVLNRDAGFPTNALDIYYYHADHLGSASWITNKEGTPIEYIHYMPYGELWYNWQASSYNERFKFTGKERDAETGYDYFGARFYSTVLLSWLSADPLSNKYPNISPYAYCVWNPIKFVDPDGNRIVVGSWFGRVLAKLGVNNFERQTMMYLKELKGMSPVLNTAISKMEDSKTITISIYPMSQYDGDKNKGVTTSSKTTVMGEKKDSEIYYDSNNGFLVDGDYSSPQAILAHELGHAENNMEGTSIKYNQEKARQGDAIEIQKGNLNEQKSIFYENIVRENQGDNARPYEYYKTEP